MDEILDIIWIASVVWENWIFLEVSILKPLSYITFSILNFAYNFVIYFTLILLVSDNKMTSVVIKNSALYSLLTTIVSLCLFYISMKSHYHSNLKNKKKENT